jgi:hypothetical protein
VLGTYQDGVVARQHLAEIAARHDTSRNDAFHLGELAGVQRGAGTRALEDLPAVWKKANKRSLPHL